MKINKFLIVGVAIAAMSLSAHAQETPSNNQQEINPTVAKTLNTVGGFFGSLVQGAKTVVTTTADEVKIIANSQGAQNLKNGVMKGTQVVSNTASDVANSDIGQSVKEGAVKSAKFVSTTAQEGAKSISTGYKEVSNESEPTIEAASMSSVSQPTTTPTLSEGVATAQKKIGSMIGFLRDKAKLSNDNTNTNDNSKVTP